MWRRSQAPHNTYPRIVLCFVKILIFEHWPLKTSNWRQLLGLQKNRLRGLVLEMVWLQSMLCQQVWELMPNFHNVNLAAFRITVMAKIQQHFASSASQCTKHYPHQAFVVRIRQQWWHIFMAKIRQRFLFGALAG